MQAGCVSLPPRTRVRHRYTGRFGWTAPRDQGFAEEWWQTNLGSTGDYFTIVKLTQPPDDEDSWELVWWQTPPDHINENDGRRHGRFRWELARNLEVLSAPEARLDDPDHGTPTGR